ncbi:TOBE domain-containing protein [Aureivirga marina]|uniref:TOBE domain-containing protein n=1 Tax=Aureivirga marina TaxID=1182451 RepID=UPI0018CB16C5|nr:hypothetical protein [Aureivirga marina]
MNSFQGNIKNIESDGNLSMLEIEVSSVIFHVLIVDNSTTSKNIVLGKKVTCMWKETEVILSKNPMEISLENCFSCTTKSIEKEKLLSKVILISSFGEVHAIISSKSLEKMNLKTKESVFAMINSNEIMLSYD